MASKQQRPLDRCEYLLPAGCKDLIDALRLEKAKRTIEKEQKAPHLVVRKPRPKKIPVVHLPSQVVVKDLAGALGVKLYKIIGVLKQMNVFTHIDQKIPFYTAAKIAKRYGYAAKRDTF